MSYVLDRTEITFNSDDCNNHKGLFINCYGKNDFKITEIAINNDKYDNNKVVELYHILNELGVPTIMRYNGMTCDEYDEFKAMEKVFGKRERNHVEIEDINMEKISVDFDSWYDSEWFCVVDKEHLGELIGRELERELGKKLIDKNAINGYEEEEILNSIEEYTDELRDEIKCFVIEYLDNNM